MLLGVSKTLREPSYFLLAALMDEPLHGYAIAQRASELSGGRVRLTAGTLYGALARLVADGLVAVDREVVVAGRKRRYHRLTGDGEQRLAEEAGRLRAAAAVVEEHRAPAAEPRAIAKPA